MESKTKIAALSLFAVMSIALTTAVCFSGETQQMQAIVAEECDHSGNHYITKNATATENGIKEYWICCKCHNYYLSETHGNWSDAGIANIIIDEDDDRYIPKLSGYDENGFRYSSDGKTIIDYQPIPGVTDIIIPEGVESIAAGAFEGSDITSISLPSTLKEISKDAFANTNNLTSIVIPGSVEDIAKNAFLDNPDSFLFGSGRDITIYLEITKEEADTMFENGWDNSSISAALVIFQKTNKATVYYKGEWHYDENNKPVANK